MLESTVKIGYFDTHYILGESSSHNMKNRRKKLLAENALNDILYLEIFESS